MSEPIVWVNENGDRRFQPVTCDGRKAWNMMDTIKWADTGGLAPFTPPPRLYRSKRRAIRVARRADRSRRRKTFWEQGFGDER